MPRRGYRKPASEAFTERLEVRFSEAQFAALRERAEDAGLPLATYARAALTGETPRRRPTRIAQDAIRQLAKIGNNLNQLTRKANSGNFPVEADLRSSLEELLVVLGRLANDR